MKGTVNGLPRVDGETAKRPRRPRLAADPGNGARVVELGAGAGAGGVGGGRACQEGPGSGEGAYRSGWDSGLRPALFDVPPPPLAVIRVNEHLPTGCFLDMAGQQPERLVADIAGVQIVVGGHL